MSKKNRSGWTLVAPPQQNAPKPGPNTPDGKAVSAQNARKHGLTAKEFIVRPDEQDAFEAFLAEHERDLQSEGALEQDFFAQIVHAAWNLRRLRILEAESLANFDPADDKQAAVADRLARYQSRLERTMRQATAELRRLQSDRALRAAIDPIVADATPPVADVAKVALTKRTREVEPVARRVELFMESMERACEIMNAEWSRRDLAQAAAAA